MPVYQAKPYLEKSINSLLENVGARIIMVDDGSTDGSAELADELANGNERISVFHQENRGVSAARNKGLELATADYVSFMDPDDFAEGGYYSRLLKNMLAQNADLAIGGYTRSFENGGEQKACEPRFDGLCESFKDFSNYIAEYESSESAVMGAVWRCVFKREIIEKNALRFNEGIRLSEDLFFLLGYINCCKSICTIDDYGYYYRVRSNSASAESYKKGLFENRLACIKDLQKSLAGNDFMSEEQKQIILHRAQYIFAYECISNEMRFNENGAKELKQYLKQGFCESLLTAEAIRQAEKENEAKKLPLILKLCRAGRINTIRLLYSLRK